ncbi:MAG: hypothetical protein F4X57_00495 [Chloroflexi bacterium]|nr:hypothetical protein [Chloroflexota bacterium]
MTSRRWTGGFPLFAVLLIALGGLLLMQTTGVLSWNLWAIIWRLWPILLIAIGINIILGARMPWVASVLIAAVLAVGIALAAFSGAFTINGFRNGTEEIGSFHELLGETESVGVNINFGAGELRLDSLPPGSPNLVEADFQGREAEVSVNRFERSAALDISNGDFDFGFLRINDRAIWDVSLSPSPTMFLDLNAGASEMTLDLSRLKVHDLSIDAGAADIEIVMPSDTGNVNADIDIGAADLIIIIPEGVGARIDADTAAGSLSIDQGRFRKQGDFYLSPDFEVLANRIYLSIDSGASSVEIR